MGAVGGTETTSARRVGRPPQLGRRLRAAAGRGVLGEIQFCRMSRAALLPRRIN